MKMLTMLIALLIVALLVYQNMSAVRDQPQHQQTTSELNPPKVPTNPGDVNQFSDQMNDFVTQQSDKQKAAINKASQ